jgi:translin
MRATEMRRFFDLREKRDRIAEELSRRIVRLCSKGIMTLHRHGDAHQLLREAQRILKKLEKLSDPPLPKALALAQQEYGEFYILKSILEKGNIPDPEEVGISYYPYLMSLADVGGELRRALLEALRRSDLKKAERLLQHMEEIFEFLSHFDHPERILPGLRRKKDILARIIEKSRGDLTLATLKR